MTQVFSPHPLDKKQLCCFFNASQEIVIARITNNNLGRNCERVIFSKERFLFEASADAYLEIHQYSQTGIRKNLIPCGELQISERFSQAK